MRPLDGIRVLGVAQWGFVPAAGSRRTEGGVDCVSQQSSRGATP